MESKSAESGGREPLPPGTNGRPFASSPSPLPAQAAMIKEARTTQTRDARGTRESPESINSAHGVVKSIRPYTPSLIPDAKNRKKSAQRIPIKPPAAARKFSRLIPRREGVTVFER